MSITYPQYPWTEGDRLFASALNAAIADGPYLANAGYVNVANFGADPTGVADSSTAFCNALAVGKAVYAPTGTYHLRCQLVVGPNQVLFGDSRGSTILSVGTDFDPTATGVISLTGRELDAPTVRDLQIAFNQTSTQGVRANFKTLADGGDLTTGIMYPPAVIITTANRFRLLGLTVSGAWDGIINAPTNGIGGFIIDNIEMGALNVGLSLDQSYDFGHIKDYHFWNFGFNNSGATYTQVYQDGNTFAAKFGVNGPVNGCAVSGFTAWEARVSITAPDTWLSFTNLEMDGNNSTLEISNCFWVQISNMYSSGAAVGANTAAQIQITGGQTVIIRNYHAFSALPMINISGGGLDIAGAFLSPQVTNQPAVVQTGGALLMRDSLISVPAGFGPWTVPVINSTAGIFLFTGNYFPPPPNGQVVAGLVCDDVSSNTVAGNVFSGWPYATPTNTSGTSSANAVFSSVTAQRPPSPTTAPLMIFPAATANAQEGKMRFHATLASAVDYSPYLAASLRAGWGSTAWDSSYLNVWMTHAANGDSSDANMVLVASFTAEGIALPLLPATASCADDAAAEAAGVPVGGTYRNGSQIMVRVT